MKLLGQVIYITLLSLCIAVMFYFFIGTRGIWGALIVFLVNFLFIGGQVAGLFTVFKQPKREEQSPPDLVDTKEWKEWLAKETEGMKLASKKYPHGWGEKELDECLDEIRKDKEKTEAAKTR
jgi:hypothetical protein